ncbi:hypothetical protein ACFTAO_38995 [Paenibacillus rhizoplanae]
MAETNGDELSGKAGTKVSLLIQRNGANKSYTVTRSEIATSSVTSKMLSSKNCLYLHQRLHPDCR